MIIAHDESYSINQPLVHVNMKFNLLINLFIFDTLDIKWFVNVPCLFNVVKEFSAKKMTGTLPEGGIGEKKHARFNYQFRKKFVRQKSPNTHISILNPTPNDRSSYDPVDILNSRNHLGNRYKTPPKRVNK